MTIHDIAKLLGAEVYCCEENADSEVHSACGSDMMSDVLMYVKNQAVLLTGLMNVQAVRTAEMMDMKCVVFVRHKKPSADMIELAKDTGIVVMSTPLRMFEACGILYANGLGTTSH